MRKVLLVILILLVCVSGVWGLNTPELPFTNFSFDSTTYLNMCIQGVVPLPPPTLETYDTLSVTDIAKWNGVSTEGYQVDDSGYVSPDSYDSPYWTNSSNAIDGDTGTYAYTVVQPNSWSQYYVGIFAAPIVANKIRVWIPANNIAYFSGLSVTYRSSSSGTWHTPSLTGSWGAARWIEFSLEGNKTVKEVRYYIRSAGTPQPLYAYLSEIQVYQVKTTTLPSMIWNKAIWGE